MLDFSKVIFPPMRLKLEWPVAACTRCCGELEKVIDYESDVAGNRIHSICLSCKHWEHLLVTRVVKGEVVAFS